MHTARLATYTILATIIFTFVQIPLFEINHLAVAVLFAIVVFNNPTQWIVLLSIGTLPFAASYAHQYFLGVPPTLSVFLTGMSIQWMALLGVALISKRVRHMDTTEWFITIPMITIAYWFFGHILLWLASPRTGVQSLIEIYIRTSPAALWSYSGNLVFAGILFLGYSSVHKYIKGKIDLGGINGPRTDCGNTFEGVLGA